MAILTDRPFFQGRILIKEIRYLNTYSILKTNPKKVISTNKSDTYPPLFASEKINTYYCNEKKSTF